MRKFRVSSGMKTAILILNEIFALVMIIVLIMTANYGLNSGSWDDLLTHRSYEESEYFQTQSVNQVNRAIRAAARATRFESDGVYDPDRLVNIAEYAEKGIITGNYDADGLYYRLGDLLAWAQKGWSYSSIEIDAQGYMTFHLSENPNAAELQADLENYFLSSNSEWNAYYQYFQNIGTGEEGGLQENYTKAILDENKRPVNYRNIVTYANEAGLDIGTIYEEMDITLQNIVSDVLSYRDNVNIFSWMPRQIRCTPM